MPHVFISYKREDVAFVQTLEQKLREADIDSWTDAQIQAGENWRFAIDEHITDAFALLVVMTPEAKQSEYVTYEWSFAMGLGLPIVPVKLRDTDLHPKLSELQWIDCTIPYREPWEVIVSRFRDLYETSIMSPRFKEIMKILDHWHFEDRKRGIAALVKGNYRQAAPKLLALVRHDDAGEVRALAIRALSSLKLTEAISVLVEMLTNEKDERLQLECVIALKHLDAQIAAPVILDLLEEKLTKHINNLLGNPQEEPREQKYREKFDFTSMREPSKFRFDDYEDIWKSFDLTGRYDFRSIWNDPMRSIDREMETALFDALVVLGSMETIGKRLHRLLTDYLIAAEQLWMAIPDQPRRSTRGRRKLDEFSASYHVQSLKGRIQSLDRLIMLICLLGIILNPEV